MASLEEIRSSRLQKLAKLREHGIDPYPARVPRTLSIHEFKSRFAELEEGKAQHSLAGRIIALRGQGAILFAVIFDGTERTQVILKKDELGEELFDLFADTVDIGDFI